MKKLISAMFFAVLASAAAMADATIDGVTYVFGVPASAQPGDLLPVRYTGSDEYDLIAEALKRP